MKRVKSPQEKKQLSLDRDRRNTYRENDKASRKNIPRHKQRSHQEERRVVAEALTRARGRADEDTLAGADATAKLRAKKKKLRAFKKKPDTPLREYLALKKNVAKTRVGFRKKRGLAKVTIALLLLAGSAARVSAQGADYVIRDFKLADGESMPELRLHYRTLGPPTGKPVLIMHGTSGSGEQFMGNVFAGELFGSGQPLDTTKYFVILPDDIGHGKSSRPSDRLQTKFPHYGYADMVEAEYRLVSDGLHLWHLHVVMGTSMGCMHSWMWAEKYPTFMDGVVPLACQPTQISGRNRMWRRMAMDDIRNDSAGGYTAAMQILSLMASSPLVLQKAGPTRDAADSAEMAIVKGRMATDNATDLWYQLDASRDYDPSADLERIQARVLAINSADDEVNPPELDIVEPLLKRVKHVKYVLLPLSSETRGHGTHTMAAVWKRYFADFMASLP